MAIEIGDAVSRQTTSGGEPTIVSEQLFCSLTGRPLQSGEVYWAPPLVTARALVAAIWTTLLHAPGTLGHILFAEQPNVPYAPEVRDRLAARRSAEQLKLLLGLLFALALIAAPIVLIAMG